MWLDRTFSFCDDWGMRRLGILLLLAAISAPIPSAAEPCRLALVLALDVSGSVNDVEYKQQLNGLAYALDSADVRRAILAENGAPVHLAVFEWSSQNHQFLVQPWISLDSDAAIDRTVARILGYRKQRAGLKTALSTAMLFAAELLREKSECWRKTIDVSGDGKNNIGPALERVYSLSEFAGITVNALVVGDPSSARSPQTTRRLTKTDLKRYYELEVIRGTGAFAMIALGYEDYERAMQLKLLRELSVPVLGQSEF